MSNSLLETTAAVLQAAKKHGATNARAEVSRSRESSVEWRDGKLDRLRESTRMGVSVALFVDGRYSANGTSDLRPEALDRFVAESVAMTRVLQADLHRKLPPVERCKARFEGDLRLLDKDALARIDGSVQRKQASELEQAMRAATGAEAILSATGSVRVIHTIRAMMDSQGTQGHQEMSMFVRSATASVRGEGDKKPSGFDYGAARHEKDLPSIEGIGKEATRRALMGIGEAPLKSGKYPCVIENVVADRLLGGLLSPLSGSALQQKRSFLLGKLGERIGAPLFDIVDDPLLPTAMASGTFDSEGMTTQRRSLFEKGVLRTYFLDTYYASKMGLEPTTGGSSNLVFPKGKQDLTGLLRAMGKGILITGFSGGNSNAATGDFSIGIRGHWVEAGRIVKPVAEMNLAGNHLTFWQGLAELGSDPYPYRSVRAPSLRFRDVQFSGV